MIRICHVKKYDDLCRGCHYVRNCYEYICPLIENWAILNYSTDRFGTYAILEEGGTVIKVPIDNISDVQTLSITEYQYMIDKKEKLYIYKKKLYGK